MAKYYIHHNEGETMKRIDGQSIEAHELRLEGKIAKFLDEDEKIIGLFNVMKFRIRREVK